MMSTEEPKLALRLRNVGVSYPLSRRPFNKRVYWALKNVSFDLYHGETLGVLGRNGAGKSTLLRLLTGIMAPDKGTMETDGSQVSLLSLGVGFIAHMTGRENAILSGLMLGMRRREVEEKMDEIIAFAELDEFIDEQLRTYSSGMLARLAFSVAFQANPSILLVDEVLGVGDIEFNQKSTKVMKERIRSNRTVVIVSHHMDTLRDLCDRVVWIEDGETFMEGEAEGILNQYQETYTHV
jgi:lipopolysaccharide transport system ATP-binding protein